MSLAPISKLHSRGQLQIYNPNINWYIDKINNNKYFSLIRFQSEWWMILKKGLKKLGLDNLPPRNIFKKEDFIQKWGQAVADAWQFNQRGNRKHELNADVLTDHIRTIIFPKPKNFYLSVSDRANYYNANWPPAGPQGSWGWIDKFIQDLLPQGEIPFNSIIFRRAVMDGSFKKLVNNIRNKKIVFVGPPYYHDIANRAKLQNLTYVKIDLFKATFHVKETLEILEENYKSDTLYIFCGGCAGAWLIEEMHKKHNDSWFIEFGRAWDAFYYFDKKVAPEIGVRWMNKSPPYWTR